MKHTEFKSKKRNGIYTALDENGQMLTICGPDGYHIYTCYDSKSKKIGVAGTLQKAIEIFDKYVKCCANCTFCDSESADDICKYWGAMIENTHSDKCGEYR